MLGALHAALAAALALASLLPAPRLVRPEALLTVIGSLAAAAALIGVPAWRPPPGRSLRFLEALVAVLAPAPVWAVAYAVSAAEPEGAARAIAGLVALTFAGFAIAKTRGRLLLTL